MTSDRPRAIGLVREDIASRTDLHELAERHGLTLVYSLAVTTRPELAGLIVAQHIAEHDAAAVLVPSYEHAEPIRCLITELAALITPVQRYPLGHRWPALTTGQARPC